MVPAKLGCPPSVVDVWNGSACCKCFLVIYLIYYHMNKQSLTLAEKTTLENELKLQGVTIAQVVTEVPEGLYAGKFQSQSVKSGKSEKLEPVISCVEYSRDNKPMAFFACKSDIANDKSGKSYEGINIALTSDLEKMLSTPANLNKDYAFRSRKGRVRTFVSLAE